MKAEALEIDYSDVTNWPIEDVKPHLLHYSVPSPPRPGAPVQHDPYGRDRDGPRRHEANSEWPVDRVVTYILSVISQIDSNLRKNCRPTDDKMDAFVKRLVSTLRQHLKHAPKKVYRSMEGILDCKFSEFWNFKSNQKTRQTTPEELRATLAAIVELLSVKPLGIVVQQGIRPATALESCL